MLSRIQPIVTSPLIRQAITLNTASGLVCLMLAILLPAIGAVAGMWLWPSVMGLILLSCILLRRRLQSGADIEQCLTRLAFADQIHSDLLAELPGNNLAVRGWNRLVSSSVVQRLLDSADQSLACESPDHDSANGLSEVVLLALPDGIAVADATGTRLYQNPAFASLLDCPELLSDASGPLMSELFGNFVNFSDHSYELTCPDAAPSMTIELHRGESTGDGVLRVSRQHVRGTEALFLWTVRDVTQQKLAVENRDSFVSAATHELRTPLSNIRAYAETLTTVEEVGVEDQHRFLNIIMSEAARLDRIIDDLLNISHMQAGSLTLDRHECQTDRLVHEVQATIQPLIESQQLDFEASIQPRLPDLVIDKDKVAAALVNLLGNAIKYTNAGGRVSLSVEHQSNEVKFHVEDTGIGIPADELTRIFDRFFRSSDVRVHEIRGTGLGLAYAQDVARLHGGRIEVTSELNKGSRFSLILPARAMEVSGNSKDNDKAAPKRSTSASSNETATAGLQT